MGHGNNTSGNAGHDPSHQAFFLIDTFAVGSGCEIFIFIGVLFSKNTYGPTEKGDAMTVTELDAEQAFDDFVK